MDTCSGSRIWAIPRLNVVLPAALSPTIPRMMGRGGAPNGTTMLFSQPLVARVSRAGASPAVIPGARFQGGGKRQLMRPLPVILACYSRRAFPGRGQAPPLPYTIRRRAGTTERPQGPPWEITCYNDTWHEI